MSWVLQAIEREALERARREVVSNPQTFFVCGCSVSQIMTLIQEYEERTGKSAMMIGRER